MAPRGAEGFEGYGVEAAAELGVAPARVLKTLVTVVDGVPAAVVAVVAVDGRVDLGALAEAAGGKRADGRARGRPTPDRLRPGISPSASGTLPTVLDGRARRRRCSARPGAGPRGRSTLPSWCGCSTPRGPIQG